MNQPKISVIVPIYKVEPYITKCLDSIIRQSYKNLEIILVDDGSPDLCGEICDEYAKNDNRITVIHKKNGGVSSARNAGLVIASGDWIGWVDSDDWIELDMYEYLLSNVLRHNADIAVCSRYEEYRRHSLYRGWKQVEILDTENALAQLLKNDTMQNFLWDKLWKKSLFDNICFPYGKTYEDIAVMHRLFEKAQHILCLPTAKYHYRQRANSIVGTSSLGNRMNHYIAAKTRYEEMKDRWPQFLPQLEGQCVAAAVNIWCSYLKSDYSTQKKYRLEIRKMAQFSKKHYRSALKYMGLGKAGKAVVYLTPYATWWAFILAYLCGWIYKRKHGREL